MLLKNQTKKEVSSIKHNLAGQIRQKFNPENGKIKKFKIQSIKLKHKHIKSLKRENQSFNNFYQSLRLNPNINVKLKSKFINLLK